MNRMARLFSILTVALVLIGLFGYFTTGVVKGTEWSPQTLEHRSYEYHVVFGFQVGPRTTESFQTSLENELHAQGYVPSTSERNRWLVVDQKGPCRTYSNRDLYCWDEETASEWIEWSRKSPELARVYWGLIVDTARAGLDSEVRRCMVDEAAEVRHQTSTTGIQNVVNPTCRPFPTR